MSSEDGTRYGDSKKNSSFIAIEFPVAAALCILYTLASFAIHEYKIRYKVAPWCHESSIAMILGIVVGATLKMSAFHHVIDFDNNLFFYLVLPPIIFSAGYSLKRRNFFRYLHLISLFGIVGTVVQFILMSFFIYGASRFTVQYAPYDVISWKQIFLLSAVLSASDEVSAMSLVRIRDYPRMGALIFGEGVVNDVLSIVLFKVLHDWNDSENTPHQVEESGINGWGIVQSLFFTIIFEMIVSCAIGVVCGLCHARMLVLLPTLREHSVHQTSLVLLFAYSSYCLAEMSGHASGILTLFVAAVTLAHYSWHSLSKKAQLSTRYACRSLSDMTEGFSFAYVGLSVFATKFDDFSIIFSALVLCGVILSRLITVLGLCAFWSLCAKGSKSPLTLKEQCALAMSGMVRGSLCWAQVQYIKRQHGMMVTTTLVVVMFTTLVSGSFLPIAMPWLITPNVQPASSVSKQSLIVEESTPLINKPLHSDKKRRSDDGSALAYLPGESEKGWQPGQYRFRNAAGSGLAASTPGQAAYHSLMNDTMRTYDSGASSVLEISDFDNSISSLDNGGDCTNQSRGKEEVDAGSIAALGKRLYVLWIRFDEKVMKRLFGGSRPNSSRRYMLEETRDMSAFSILSERSGKEISLIVANSEKRQGSSDEVFARSLQAEFELDVDSDDDFEMEMRMSSPVSPLLRDNVSLLGDFNGHMHSQPPDENTRLLFHGYDKHMV